MTGCSFKYLPIDPKWYPLTKIVERPKIPFVNSSLSTTIGQNVYVTDIHDWKEEYPKNSTSRDDLLAHEYVHSYRQFRLGLTQWLALYTLNQGFKRNEEKLAYYVSIKRRLLRKEKIDKPHYIKSMSTNYFGMMTKEEAKQWIESVIAGTWKPQPGELPEHPEIPE